MSIYALAAAARKAFSDLRAIADRQAASVRQLRILRGDSPRPVWTYVDGTLIDGAPPE